MVLGKFVLRSSTYPEIYVTDMEKYLIPTPSVPSGLDLGLINIKSGFVEPYKNFKNNFFIDSKIKSISPMNNEFAEAQIILIDPLDNSITLNKYFTYNFNDMRNNMCVLMLTNTNSYLKVKIQSVVDSASLTNLKSFNKIIFDIVNIDVSLYAILDLNYIFINPYPTYLQERIDNTAITYVSNMIIQVNDIISYTNLT